MTTATRHRPLRQATDLIAHAQAHGWTVRETWTPPGYRGTPALRVVIARNTPAGPIAYRLSWCTDGTRPEKWKARTPRNAKWSKAPALSEIRAAIARHPVRKAVQP